MVRRKRSSTDMSENMEEFPVGKRFKIMAEDFDSQYYQAASGRAILKGPCNNNWHVEIQKNEFGIAITEGWRLCCTENSLKLGDLLVFIYEGDMKFEVQIFDGNDCEREDAFNFNKEFSSFGSCEVEDGAPETSDAPTPKKRKCKKQKKSNGPREQYQIFSQRRPITDHERRKAIDAATAFESDLPLCKIVMKKYHVNYYFFVNIPAAFRNRHLPFEEAILTLLDPSGRSWEVRYISLKRATRGLSGGWIPFLVGNNIEEGDECVFELIEPKKLHVHIFRVVEEVVPLCCGIRRLPPA